MMLSWVQALNCDRCNLFCFKTQNPLNTLFISFFYIFFRSFACLMHVPGNKDKQGSVVGDVNERYDWG